MGGDILFVECSLSEGKGVLSTTGNLGDVMKESATIALQYLKAHPELSGVDGKSFYKKISTFTYLKEQSPRMVPRQVSPW